MAASYFLRREEELWRSIICIWSSVNETKQKGNAARDKIF